MQKRHFFKSYLFFSRSERRGILWLTLLVVAVVAAGEIWLRAGYRDGDTSGREMGMQAQLDSFLASVRPLDTQPVSGRAGDTYPSSHRSLTPFPFDPNHADSAVFTRLGLPGWMARNVVRYRAAGGLFRKPQDFSRIYGLTGEQYRTLEPYIRIRPADTLHRMEKESADTFRLYQAHLRTASDTVAVEKYAPGTLVDLNRADTTELKKIPGIGSGIARMIAGYRRRLGGFYSIGQLREINLDAGRLESWFVVDTTAVRRINLNRAGVDLLRNHPYIDFYQAKALVEYRRKHGPLTSLKPFVLYEEFTSADLERIGHYVCFE